MKHARSSEIQPSPPSNREFDNPLYFARQFGAGALTALALTIYGPQIIDNAKHTVDSIAHPEIIGTVIEPAENNEATAIVAENAVDKLARQYQIPRYIIRDVIEETQDIGPKLGPNDALEVDLEKDFTGIYSVEIDLVPKSSLTEIATHTPER